MGVSFKCSTCCFFRRSRLSFYNKQNAQPV